MTDFINMKTVPDPSPSTDPSTGNHILPLSIKSPDTATALPFLSQVFLQKFSKSLSYILNRRSLFINRFVLQTQFKAFLYKLGSDEQLFPLSVFSKWMHFFIRSQTFASEELTQPHFSNKNLRYKDYLANLSDFYRLDVEDPRDLTVHAQHIFDQDFERLDPRHKHFIVGVLNYFGEHRIKYLGLTTPSVKVEKLLELDTTIFYFLCI